MSLIIPSIMLQLCGSTLAVNSNPITNFFLSPCIVWFPIVITASIAVVLLVAFIYMLSPLVGRSDIRVWARVKIYDEVANVVFVLVFLAFATLIVAIPVAAPLRVAGLLPSRCDPNPASPSTDTGPSLHALTLQFGPGADNLFTVADCDIWQFNQDLHHFSTTVFWSSIILSAAPRISFFPNVAVDAAHGGLDGVGISFAVNLLPIELVHHYLIPVMTGFFAIVIASLVMQIVTNAALPIFATLMVIGLVARSFGVSRTFGGAMIAFAIGIGFVLPLMTTITYGFIDYTIETLPTYATTFGLKGGWHVFSYFFSPSNFIPLIGTIINPFAGITEKVDAIASAYLGAFHESLVFGGFIAAGITLVPLMNLVIVDAFIVDFSKAIGERMDFLSMLTRIL